MRTDTLTSANARVVVGDAGTGEGVMVLHVTAVTGAGTLAVKGRVTGSGVADAAGVDLAYVDRTSGATVAGGTAISAPGIYEVPATGVDVILELASGTSVTVASRPVGLR